MTVRRASPALVAATVLLLVCQLAVTPASGADSNAQFVTIALYSGGVYGVVTRDSFVVSAEASKDKKKFGLKVTFGHGLAARTFHVLWKETADKISSEQLLKGLTKLQGFLDDPAKTTLTLEDFSKNLGFSFDSFDTQGGF